MTAVEPIEPSWPDAARRTRAAPLPVVRQIGVLLHPTRDLRAALAEVGRWGRRSGVRIVATGDHGRRSRSGRWRDRRDCAQAASLSAGRANRSSGSRARTPGVKRASA